MYRNQRQPHLRLPAEVPAWSVQAGDVIRIDPHDVPGDGTAPGHGPVEVTAVGTETDRDGKSPLATVSWRASRAGGIAFYARRAKITLLQASPSRRSIRPGPWPC